MKPLYTADGRGRKWNQGWSKEGIQKYKELVKHVRENHATYPKADERYLGRKREEKVQWGAIKVMKKKEALEEREGGLELPLDDFSDSDEL